jgi:hypothetical protein
MRLLVSTVVCVELVMLMSGAAPAATDGVAAAASPLIVEVEPEATGSSGAGDVPSIEGAAACDEEACEDAPCDEAADESAKRDDPNSDQAAGKKSAYAPTHHQVALIPVNLEGVAKGSLHTFCLAPDGRVLAACSLDGVIDSGSELGGVITNAVMTDGSVEFDAAAAVTNQIASPPTTGDVRVFSPEGKLLDVWTLAFAPEAIGIGSDGKVYVAGAGKLARYSLDGKLLNEAPGPQVAPLVGNRDAIREEVLEEHKSSLDWMTQYVEDLDRQIEPLDKNIARLEKEAAERREAAGETEADEPKPVDETAAAFGSVFRLLGSAAVGKAPDPRRSRLEGDLERQRALRASLVEQKKMYQQMAKQQGDQELTEEDIEDRVDASIAYKIKVASISEADGDVFLATGASKGHGFSVWRTSRHFDNATMIVDKLSGCCGQMDVQACEAGVFVAENSRKRVAAFDRSGKSIGGWGSSGEDVNGFGCCCNPMNVAFGPQGSVYTAESTSGRIKRYSTGGELIELVGTVDLVPGCKKVAIAVGPGGDRVYMLDQTRHHIVVMEREGLDEQPEPEGANKDKLSAVTP